MKLIITALILTICAFKLAMLVDHMEIKLESISDIFDKTADDRFEAIIGNIDDVQKRLDRNRDMHERKIAEIKKIYGNNASLLQDDDIISTTTAKTIEVTPFKPFKRPQMTIKDVKINLRKIEIFRMLEDNSSPIPNFKNGEDDPLELFKRFKEMENRTQEKVAEENSKFRRMLYIYTDNITRIQDEKQRLRDLMRQFIYMARYKMGMIFGFRKKYMKQMKYRLGFLFGLLRLVRYQQKIIYNTFKSFYDTITNSMIHLQLYYKILRFDVDIKDLVRYVTRIAYDLKLQSDPTYYDDSPEIPKQTQP